MTGKPQGNLQPGKLRKLQALRKSTAHGRKASNAAKNPPTQPQEYTSKLESDKLTHSPRVQNPEGEAAEGGAALAQGRKPSGVTGHLYQDTSNPMLNLHCRSRSANRSQLGVEPKESSQLHDTQRKTAGAPGKMQSSHTKSPHRAGGEEEDTAPPPQKETPNTYTGTTRDGGLQLKHTRLATVGEREEENRQMEQKRQHQKCSLGIKAKIPKKNRRPQTSAKIAKLGKKTSQLQHCARPAEESAP